MKRVGGSDQPFRLMLLQPCELDRLLAGVEAGAGRRIVSRVIRASHESRGHLGRTGIEPDQGIADRFAAGVDQPATVALTGHGNADRAACQAGYDRRQIAQRLLGVVPCPQHVLLDAAVPRTTVGIGT